ncbi:MAG: DUF45 domain-containing protein [bacterium]|nr:DUF45 domain-containing protein [bacterium]
MDYPSQLKLDESSFPIEYEVVYKSSSSVRIKNGKVILKLSRFAREKKRDEIVAKFLKWAQKRLAKVAHSEFILPEYKNGGRICTHNKVYDLQIFVEDRRSAKTVVDEEGIKVFVSADKLDRVKEYVEKAIIKDQTSYLCEVVDELNQLYFQERYNLCRFKRMNHRFGSCSSKRNINIAYRLLFAPRDAFRYVCLHELAHLKQMNHSKKFWDLVACAMPDYKVQEKWLRDSGFMLG